MGDPKIAVIGAGPAGCTLARILRLKGLHVTVYEGEPSPDYRAQGGTLDLHEGSGLIAITEAGLWDTFKQHGRYDAQYLAIVDKDLRYLFVRDAQSAQHAKGRTGQRPEIDRAKLREILVNSLPAGMIQWGHRIKSIDNGTITFDNGDTASDFDLIVGAEGAWSKVRNAIDSKLVPFYTGVAYHDLVIPDAANIAPETTKLVHKGSVFACGEGQRISIQQMGNGTLQVHTSFVRKDPNWMNQDKCGYDVKNLEEVKRAMLAEYSNWCPELLDAISKAGELGATRSLYVLPVGARWEHKPGLTLIGDAAHLMAPHAGEGVNLALEDAMKLAAAIYESWVHGKNLDEEVKAFEADMFVRAKKIQKLSNDLLKDWMFTPGAPKSVMPKVISRHVNQELPTVLHPLGTASVYSYFFFRNLVS